MAHEHDRVTGSDEVAGAPIRRRAGFGVCAGLVAGGAIGLLAVAPDLSSAATPDGGVEEEPSGDVAEEGSGGALRTGDRLRESLQPLVDDGTIDGDQADAVASHLAEQRPERRGRRPVARRLGLDGDVVAELIGIDVESLREQLRDGASIAEVADANGVDPQTVVDALVDEAEAHLDLAVDVGRLTADEAMERAERLEARITARVNGERPARSATR